MSGAHGGVAALVRSLAGTGAAAGAGTLLLTVLAALGEGAAVLLLVPLLRLVGIDTAGGATGAVDAAIRRGFAAAGVEPALHTVLALYVAAVAAQATLAFGETWAHSRLQHRFVLRLRERAARAVAHARWETLARERASELAHALHAEADRVGVAVLLLVYFASQLAASAVYVALALRLSPAVTLVALLAAGLVALALRGTTTRVRRAGEDMTRDGAALLEAASMPLDALKVVKSYGAEDRYVARIGSAARRLAATQVHTDLAYAASRWVSAVGGVALLASVLYFAAGRLRVGTAALLLLVLVFSRLVPRIAATQQSWQRLVHQLPAFVSLQARVERLERERQPEGAPGAPLVLRGGVRLRNVSFAYPQGAEAVVDASLLIPAGQVTTLVGPSGSGKSTLLDLVAGLLHPTAGRVEVDGAPLDGALRDGWRRSIAYVTQDPVIFGDTVRSDLAWVRPGATDDDLWESLRLADADGFVARLPGGLDAPLGDRGAGLSGGERQRLALARALLRQPTLLILDEVTSALDAGGEARVAEAVARLRGRVTVLASTHRPALAAIADAVHRVEGGRIVSAVAGTAPTRSGE